MGCFMCEGCTSHGSLLVFQSIVPKKESILDRQSLNGIFHVDSIRYAASTDIMGNPGEPNTKQIRSPSAVDAVERN